MQRYRCNNCGKRFQNQRRPARLTALLWRKYVWERQTLEQLARAYKKSIPWIQKQLDAAPLSRGSVLPQCVIAVTDTTFFGRHYGILVVRCPKLKKNLYWKEVCAETPEEYVQARLHLQRKGFAIQAAVIDGKRGVLGVFSDIPVQMCQFHQIAIMRRYLTSRPKLEAGKELRAIALALPALTESSCRDLLDEWHGRWEAFLKERTYTGQGKRWFYTHRRIRSAYRSICINLPYLFTYQKYPHLKIPNTTNSIDGYFSRVKGLLNVHRGLTPKRRYRIIQEILGK